MAVAWSLWFVTLSCILIGTVNSSTSNITVSEFCTCWSVQSTSVKSDSYTYNGTVVLSFRRCWLDNNANLTSGVDVVSNTDLVKFGLTVASSGPKESNCTVDNVCSLTFGINALRAGKPYTATIQPQCDTCNVCNSKVIEFNKAIPTTTIPPSTTKRYRPLQHKYLFPTLLIGTIVCIITAFIFTIRRWRQRIHHARKERAAASASFANLQEQADNNNGRGDNPSPPPQYGTTEQLNGGAHYLNISEKHGIVNDGFDFKN